MSNRFYIDVAGTWSGVTGVLNIFCDPSLEMSHQDVSYDRSQHNYVFIEKIRKIIFELSSIPPHLWSSASTYKICFDISSSVNNHILERYASE